MATIDRKETTLQKKEEKRNKFGGTYKEELVAMIETKNVLAAERKEEKTTRWNEVKMLEDKKQKSKLVAEERNLKTKEHTLAREEERLRDVKRAEDRAIMFMNPITMDDTIRKYWQLTRGEILTQTGASLQNGGGGDDSDGSGGGREDGGGGDDGNLVYGGGGCDFLTNTVLEFMHYHWLASIHNITHAICCGDIGSNLVFEVMPYG